MAPKQRARESSASESLPDEDKLTLSETDDRPLRPDEMPCLKGCSTLCWRNKASIFNYLMYFGFMITLIIVVNNMRPSFYGNQFIRVLRQHFVLRENSLNSVDSAFADINDEAFMWTYLKTYAMPNLFQDKYLDGSPKPDRNDAGTILMNLRRIGAVRIRQLRVREDTCHLRKLFGDSVDTCAAPFSRSAQSKAPFGGPNVTFSYETQPGEQLFFIERRFYPGGGFIRLLESSSLEAAQTEIQTLIDNRFVDAQTRLIDLRFAFYNAYLDQVAVCTLAFEFLAGGGVRPYSQFRLVSLTGMPSGRHATFRIFFEALLYVFVGYMIFHNLFMLVRKRGKYFASLWNWLDMALIALFILLFAFRMHSVKVLVDFDFTAVDDTYVDFSKVEFIRLNERRCAAFAVFLSFMKAFRFMASNPKLNQLVNTLAEASSDMVLFLVVILIVLFGFAFAAQLLFGELVKDFSQFSQTLAKLVRIALGDFDFDNLSFADYAIGPFFFYAFIFFVVFFLFQMFLAIILGAHERVMSEVDEQKWAGAEPGPLTQASLIFKNCIRRLFGYSSVRVVTEAERTRAIHDIDKNRDGFIDADELNDLIKRFPSRAPDLLGVEQAKQIYRRYNIKSPGAFNLAEQRAFFSVLDDRRQHIVLMEKMLSLKRAMRQILPTADVPEDEFDDSETPADEEVEELGYSSLNESNEPSQESVSSSKASSAGADASNDEVVDEMVVADEDQAVLSASS